jgi:DNA-binding MarR family transcriptional regulator
MSIAFYELLSLLAANPAGAMRMTELAAATHSSPSRITHAIDRMAARGWVERQGCVEDRRGCSASLTAEGGETLARARVQHDASVHTHLYAHLSPAQMDSLCSISRSLLDHLRRARSR